jgi:hypothetical protein
MNTKKFYMHNLLVEKIKRKKPLGRTRPRLVGKRMLSSGMLRSVALVRTDVWEEPSTSIIKVTRVGDLGTTLAVSSN